MGLFLLMNNELFSLCGYFLATIDIKDQFFLYVDEKSLFTYLNFTK